MDDLDWKSKKASLKVLKSHSTLSTNLKRKQTIINRLKNVSNENFTMLLHDLENENLNKFHTEIVNNLLLNPMITNPSLKLYSNVFLEVQKVVEIIYLFSFDSLFFSYLTTTMKKIHSQNWAVSCIFIEVFILNLKIKKSLNSLTTVDNVALSLIKHLKDCPIGLILYTLEFFDCNPAIFNEIIKNEIKNANLENLSALKKCAELMGISDEIRIQDQYVHVITPLKGEFDFYEDFKPIDRALLPKFTPSLIKNIEKKSTDLQLLDFIGQNIYDRPDLVTKLLKKKKKIDFIPCLARILAKCFKNKKTLIDSIIGSSNSESDLVLIAECSKFNIIGSDELFSILYNLLEQNQVEKLCTILYSAGRFILYKKETNSRAIDLFEKIRSWPMDEISRITATHCVSIVLNPECSKIDILDFFRWFFNKSDFEKSEIFDEIKKSKNFLLILFAQPGIFENKPHLLKAIKKSEMYETMVDFYLNAIEKTYLTSKTFSLDYVYALGSIVKSRVEQCKIIDLILKIRIDEATKYKMILILLDAYDREIHVVYLQLIREKSYLSSELESLFFNFCEKYHHEFDMEESNSFDRELMCMYDSD